MIQCSVDPLPLLGHARGGEAVGEGVPRLSDRIEHFRLAYGESPCTHAGQARRGVIVEVTQQLVYPLVERLRRLPGRHAGLGHRA